MDGEILDQLRFTAPHTLRRQLHTSFLLFVREARVRGVARDRIRQKKGRGRGEEEETQRHKDGCTHTLIKY